MKTKKEYLYAIVMCFLWPLWISFALFWEDDKTWGKFKKETKYIIVWSSLVTVLWFLFPITFTVSIITFVIWLLISVWGGNGRYYY
jgi:hypothetical protein